MRPSEQKLVQNSHILAIFGVFQAWPIYLGQIARKWVFAPDSESLAQIMKIGTIKKHCYVVKTRLKMKNKVFWGKKSRFLILAKNPETNTTLL